MGQGPGFCEAIRNAALCSQVAGLILPIILLDCFPHNYHWYNATNLERISCANIAVVIAS
jgi:hypothetical protein